MSDPSHPKGPAPQPPKAASRPRRRAGDAGVTLIEMMVVLVIIGIVAALVVPNVIGRPDEARATVAQTDMKTIATSLELYRLDAQRYPTTEQGLSALVTRPTAPPVPDRWAEGGYLGEAPVDPWGNPYGYRGEQGGADYTLLSLGADGAEGGEGVDADLTLTSKGAN